LPGRKKEDEDEEQEEQEELLLAKFKVDFRLDLLRLRVTGISSARVDY